MADSEVTQILNAVARGDPRSAAALLPLVYEELRRLAAQRVSVERSDHTLQATALVHEAYLRLVGAAGASVGWNGRGHFFGAAAEAMRRILVENARGRGRIKRGGGRVRVDLDDVAGVVAAPREEMLAIDEALTRLESVDAMAASVVKLRYFAGLTMPQVAESLGVPLRTVERNWRYARTWLHRELSGSSADQREPGDAE